VHFNTTSFNTFERFRCGTGTELTKGVGADKICKCVEFLCVVQNTEHSNITMNRLVQAVKATGSIELLEFCSQILSQKKNCRKKDTWILTWSLDERAAIATGQANIKHTTVSFLH
jgi:hypothetical protein